MDQRLPHSFLDMAKGDSRRADQPPNSIPASAIDENFATCLPAINNGYDRPYDISVTPKAGWFLKPRVPFLICENGKPVTYMFFASRLAVSEQ